MKANVMQNKNMIYFPANMGLRNRGITHIVQEELSANRIVFRTGKGEPKGAYSLPLKFDKKAKGRQHALVKKKSLVNFMMAVNDGGKWDIKEEGTALILTPVNHCALDRLNA